MTRQTIILFLYLICTSTFGQVDSTKIYGWVLAEAQLEKKFVRNATINLYCGKFIYETVSDSNGYYSFNINKFLDTVILKVQINKGTTTGSNNDRLFAPSDTRIKLVTTKGTPLKHIFNLKISTGCGSLPEINFKFNSIKLVVDTVSGISIIASILKDNPNIVAEISAHCDIREKSILSNKRADFVISELVKNGIDPKRLVSKGYGSTQPLIPLDIIKKAKTIEEKEQLFQKNRRAVIRVLTFDFKDK